MRIWLATVVLVMGIGLIWLALPTRSHRPRSGEVMTELTVRDVIPLGSQHQAAVILVPPHGEVIVPVLVDEEEGQALAAQLRGQPSSRLPSGLLSRTIAGLGGKLVRVELASLDGDRVHARLVFDQRGHGLVIEGDAAEALGLALMSKVPLLASKQVMDGLGLTRRQIRDLTRPDDHAPALPNLSEKPAGISL